MKHEPTFKKAAMAVTRWIGSPESLFVHTVIFIASFLAVSAGFIGFDSMLLVLTTIVSLEAIYLSIFIQMTINFTTASLEEVEQDIDEIQEDVDEIQENIDELQEDVEEIEESDTEEEKRDREHHIALAAIQHDLRKLMDDISKLQHKQ